MSLLKLSQSGLLRVVTFLLTAALLMIRPAPAQDIVIVDVEAVTGDYVGAINPLSGAVDAVARGGGVSLKARDGITARWTESGWSLVSAVVSGGSLFLDRYDRNGFAGRVAVRLPGTLRGMPTLAFGSFDLDNDRLSDLLITNTNRSRLQWLVIPSPFGKPGPRKFLTFSGGGGNSTPFLFHPWMGGQTIGLLRNLNRLRRTPSISLIPLRRGRRVHSIRLPGIPPDMWPEVLVTTLRDGRQEAYLESQDGSQLIRINRHRVDRFFFDARPCHQEGTVRNADGIGLPESVDRCGDRSLQLRSVRTTVKNSSRTSSFPGLISLVPSADIKAIEPNPASAPIRVLITTPSPPPSSTPTPPLTGGTPWPTHTPAATYTPYPTYTDAPTCAPEAPTQTPLPTYTIPPTHTATATPTITPTATATVTPTITPTPDIIAPSRPEIVFDQTLISATNQQTVSFTMSGVELGAVVTYVIDDTNSGTATITGTIPIISNPQSVSGVDLTSLSNGLIILGVYLRDAAGNVSQQSVAAIQKDAFVPTITDVSAPNGTYVVGSYIPITVAVSKAVSVTGTPRIALNVAGANVWAPYEPSLSSSGSLVFRYQVQATDNDPDGIVITSGSIALNGGTIRDPFSNDLVPTFAIPNTSSILTYDVAPHCKALRDVGFTGDGVYQIDPDGVGGLSAFNAYCDMATGALRVCPRCSVIILAS